MAFKTTIKEHRLSKGLSQQTTANLIGVGIRLYQYYEAGEREPAVRTAIRIAHALGTTVEELFPIEVK